MTDQASFQTDPAWAAQITADEERCARRWLQEISLATAPGAHNASVALRMLARPVMPEHPDPEALRLMRVACEAESYSPAQAAYEAYRALYAHLSRPATKEVEVWRVEYAQRTLPFSASFHTSREADEYLVTVARWPDVACIRVTGPHKQTVPA